MVNARAHAHVRGHARLHKRGHSASSSLASPLSPVADGGAFTFSRSETHRTTIEESWPEMPHHADAATSTCTSTSTSTWTERAAQPRTALTFTVDDCEGCELQLSSALGTYAQARERA